MIGDSLDLTTLSQLILWIVTGGGASALAYWLIDHVPFLANLASKPKRLASVGLTLSMGFLAYGLSIAVGYDSSPANLVEFTETAFALGGLILAGSSLIHGWRDL